MDKPSLTHLAGRYREAETRANILRRELAESIRQAHKDGVQQKDICEATGYTRQQVRRIVLSEDKEDPIEVAPAAEPTSDTPAEI